MDKAKKFFYLSSGLFLLILSYQLGVRAASAQSPPLSAQPPERTYVYHQGSSPPRFDGYLLCTQTGELWRVSGDEKKLVTDKK